MPSRSLDFFLMIAMTDTAFDLTQKWELAGIARLFDLILAMKWENNGHLYEKLALITNKQSN